MKPVPKILIHAGLLIVCCFVAILCLQGWLGHYTRHDAAILVPDVTGISIEEAAETLTGKGLRCEVVDSLFQEEVEPGVILEQKPAGGKKVKPDRIVFLVINSKEDVSVPVPYVKDYSQRQAVATLEGMGFTVERISYVPSEFKNLVIDLCYKGVSIEPGAALPKGSSLSLVVGQGLASEVVLIPDLSGLPLDSAILSAHSHNVNIGEIEYDIRPANEKEAALYKVISQVPEAGTEHIIGERIRIRMSRTWEIPMETSPDPSLEND